MGKRLGRTATTFCLLLIINSLTKCSKDQFTDPVSEKKIALAGTSNSPAKWRFVAMSINDTIQKISLADSQYVKKYSNDGIVLDTNGNSGQWSIAYTDSLFESTINCNTGAKSQQRYKIIDLNSYTSLVLECAVNGQKITSRFIYVP
jgi:hypothetical protein